jgi:hypothetical protein
MAQDTLLASHTSMGTKVKCGSMSSSRCVFAVDTRRTLAYTR